MGMLRAHVDLAKAEGEGIKDEAARAGGLGAAALACLILLGFLVPIGGILFYGDWVFGSIGWGLLHGTELLIGIAVAAVLVALRVPGLGKDVVIGVILGVIVAVVLGLSLPNQLFRAIGDATSLAVDPAVRPFVVGVVLLALMGAVVGLVIGAKTGEGPPRRSAVSSPGPLSAPCWAPSSRSRSGGASA